MKQLLVISGKGGTGKTTLTASFAALSTELILADCDVDAADLHLLLHPVIQQRHDFICGKIAQIDQEQCRQCMQCLSACHFQAIQSYAGEGVGVPQVRIDPIQCEGCTVCSYVCPHDAVQIKENLSGEWYQSETRFGPMVHAKLGIGEENSGKLVNQVLSQAREIGESGRKELLLIDGPPGIGCPVISSFSGTDLVLIVTEPTVSGWHDLQRVLDLAEHFQIPALVCVNKADLARQMTLKIRNYCAERQIGYVGEVPFDPQIPQLLSQGKIPVEVEVQSGFAIRSIHSQVLEELSRL